MKNVLKLLFLTTIIIGFWSCEKDENKIYFEGGTAPVLSSSVTGNIPLGFLTQGNEAVKLSWTNPDYNFTTGTSSQNVNYILEIDTVGADFTNPGKQSIAISNNLSKTFTQSELNTYMLGLNLATGIPHQIQMRLKSTLANNNAALYSNTINFTVTPYSIPPTVAPPASGKLFIVGSATNGGWNNPVPVPAQEFTKVTNTLYTLTVALIGGGSYLLLPVNGDWSAKYGAMGGNNSNNPDGDDFKPGGGDLLAPAASGTYKIEVNFQTGKFKLTKL